MRSSNKKKLDPILFFSLKGIGMVKKNRDKFFGKTFVEQLISIHHWEVNNEFIT